MKRLENKVAVITGAGSGIGRELAIRLAQEGCVCAVCDVDPHNLAKTAELAANGKGISTHVVDVANRDQVYEFAELVSEQHGQVDLLINNASVLVVDSVEDVSYHDFEWLMGVNFWGMVYCTKAFLPFLRERPEAHIVNVSSVDGMVGTPNNGPYCAAKFAVCGFTETLWQELHRTNVRVSCVLPGGVKTNLVRNARYFKMPNPSMSREEAVDWFEHIALSSPEKAAHTIIKGIKKNKHRILVGKDAWIIDLLKRLMPEWTTRFAGYQMRNVSTSTFRWFKSQQSQER
ncbi:MAG: SDR family oxidoreductase [Thermodesulfobacteriota bacterium]